MITTLAILDVEQLADTRESLHRKSRDPSTPQLPSLREEVVALCDSHAKTSTLHPRNRIKSLRVSNNHEYSQVLRSPASVRSPDRTNRFAHRHAPSTTPRSWLTPMPTLRSVFSTRTSISATPIRKTSATSASTKPAPAIWARNSFPSGPTLKPHRDISPSPPST